jgi:hypothetical protein
MILKEIPEMDKLFYLKKIGDNIRSLEDNSRIFCVCHIHADDNASLVKRIEKIEYIAKATIRDET